MWKYSVRLILRNRPAILTGILILTIVMGYFAFQVKYSYESMPMLPSYDSTYIKYKQFKERFGEDGNVITVGVTNPHMFRLEEFNAWYDLGNDIRQLDGIEEVVSIARTLNIVKDTITHKFEFRQLVTRRPATQKEVDSLREVVMNLPFYRGLLYSKSGDSFLMGITLNKNKLNDKSRVALVYDIKKRIEEYRDKHQVEVHMSGLPYIRTLTAQKVKHELLLFIILSVSVSVVILSIFFKSLKVVLSSMVVVGITVIWVLGTISLFGYKITLLTGVIPSLIIIIAIENCIYIVNKYHWEYKSHGNKVLALSRVVQRIGFASLMTNTATALGFAAFILISNAVLREFGVVTALNIMIEFFLCITLLPILFSYLPPPDSRQTKHLTNRNMQAIMVRINELILNHRKQVYLTALVLILVAGWGISRMKISGKVVDDLGKNDPIQADLKFFEKGYGGVMPFEVSIDTRKKNGVMRMSTINKIAQLQDTIACYPLFSKPLSLAELLKFARQAFFNGQPDQYEMPDNQEKNFILSYLPKNMTSKKNLLHSFIDSNKQFTRVSFQMADVGTYQMNHLLDSIQPQVDSIFNPKDYKVTITGNSVVYSKGTEFLIRNLFESVAIAIVLISLLMALLFSSFRMILVSMIPNIIPLLLAAALMGFSGIPLKPSTIIVFSIALGISVDNAIQYLSRYRHELKVLNGNIRNATLGALREAGYSMIYTSIVLVLGFSVFIISGFGGTQALGILISTTLFLAMFFNIIALPSLLLSLDKRVVTKAFREPILEIYEEDESGEEPGPGDPETQNH